MTALANKSLDEIESMYRNGLISYQEMVDYIKRWNAAGHFTQAVFVDGRVRNFHLSSSVYYRSLAKEFGLTERKE